MRFFTIIAVILLITVPLCIFSEAGELSTGEAKLATESGGVSVGYSEDEAATVPEDALIVKGKIGIGIINPLNQLDVAGGVVVGKNYVDSVTPAPTDGLVIEGNVGIGIADPEEKLVVADGNIEVSSGDIKVSNGNIRIDNGNIVLGDNWLSADGDDEGVYVAGDGSVGIGVEPTDAKFMVESPEGVVGHVYEYSRSRYNVNADAIEYTSPGRCECDTSSKEEDCPSSFESKTNYEGGCDDLYWGNTKPPYMDPVYGRMARRYYKSGTKDITAPGPSAIRVTKGRSIFNDKVGIGVISPSEMLDVGGNVRLGDGNSIYYYREPVSTATGQTLHSWQDWRLIYIEDFESGRMGWTISGSEGGRVRGRPGSFSEYNYILRNGGNNYISRDFNVGNRPVLVKVKFTYWFIDTWDQEWGQLSVSTGQGQALRTFTLWRQQGKPDAG
ncbi:MAG: hypothetical protein JSV34_01810, partial [Candidatus Omnitrophota bacterium]